MAKIVDFKDLVDAVMEELKLQEGDSVNRDRVKRIINEVYIQEVVPFTRWKWLKGHGAVKFAAAYSAGTASVTPDSQTITLSTAPSVSLGSFAGKTFSTSNLNEIYIIETHTAGSATFTISSPYLGTLEAEALYKIWTDKVNLPVDCRETETVWHNMRSTPMKAVGLQKFREISLQGPKAEGYPTFYYTDDYYDPTSGTDETESDRYRQLRVYPAVSANPVTINFDYTKEVSELVDDSDEPAMPVEDRIVLKYGALKIAWQSIGRSAQDALMSRQDFETKLQRMAGKIEDTQDKPRIQPDALYLKSRRAPRYKIGSLSGGSGISSGGGGTSGTPTYLEDVTINGATITGNVTVSSGITIDGVDISELDTDFEEHLFDSDGAHTASAISVTPGGNLAANDVQDALVEHQLDIDNINTDITAIESDVTQLQADVVAAQGAIDDHISDTSAAHAASAVSNTPSGNLAATTVQAALNELQTDVDTRATSAALAAHEADTTAIHGIADTADLTLKSTLTTKGDLYVRTASAITRQGIGSDGQVLTADSTQANGLKWANSTGGGEGVNFITGGTAETSNIFSQYNDSSTTRPVDGTGGTATNLTSAVSSTSPLAGTQSFVLTKSGSASTQGMGWSLPLTVDTAYRAKVAQIEFDYIVNSGTFVAGSSSAESDIIVYIYDVTNSQLIEPSSIKLLSNSSTISDKFIANFQTSATGSSYRLILHCQSTSTANYSLKLDNIAVRPCSYVYGTPITDWNTNWTPTGSWVSNATYTGRWRQVGDEREYDVAVAATGTPTSATLTVNLPSGHSIDTTKLATTTNKKIGWATIHDNGTDEYEGTVFYNSTTAVTARVLKKSAGNDYVDLPVVNATQPMTWVSGDSINLQWKVPIAGLSSSVQMSDGYDGRLIAAQASTSSQTITNGGTRYIVNASTIAYDKSGAITTGANWKFTAQSQGIYCISYVSNHTSVTLTTGASAIAELYKNGSFHKDISGFAQQAASASSVPLSGYVEVELNANDYIDVREAVGGSVSMSISAATIYISKKQAPTTISATEFVGMRYTNTAGTSFNGTPANVPFVTREYDSHAGWNGTDTYTCPIAGYYSIQAAINYTVGTYTAGHYVELVAFKGATKIAVHAFGTAATATNYVANHISTTVYCNAGETILLKARNDATRTLETYTGANFIAITRVK